MRSRSLGVVLLTAVLGAVACGHAERPMPRLHGPIGAAAAAWIPADAVLVVVADGAGAVELGALLAAMELGAAGAPGAMGERETTAWRVAGIEPRGGLWMLLDVEADVSARCAAVGPAAAAADALVAAGGVARAAPGARLVDLDAVTTVLRDGVACSVTGGARSGVERQALRLAGLAAGERLVDQEAARALLGELPMAPLVLWAHSDAVDAVLAIAGLPVGLLDTAAATAIAVDVDAAGRAVVTLRAPAGAVAPPAAPAPVAIGAIVRGPAATDLPPNLALPADDNPDVPLSAEYAAASAALGEALAHADALGERVRDADRAARTAWITTWGVGTATLAAQAGTLEVVIEWRAPGWPPATLRATAEAAVTAARVDVAALLAERAALMVTAGAQLDALIKLRARDVAAWDRAQRAR